MKTAVSIKDDVFQKAKISRSQLYTDAVEEYLAKRDEADLIARINAVCDEVDTSLDPAIRHYQSRMIKREKW